MPPKRKAAAEPSPSNAPAGSSKAPAGPSTLTRSTKKLRVAKAKSIPVEPLIKSNGNGSVFHFSGTGTVNIYNNNNYTVSSPEPSETSSEEEVKEEDEVEEEDELEVSKKKDRYVATIRRTRVAEEASDEFHENDGNLSLTIAVPLMPCIHY
jgi:hypothetical protein